MLTTTHNLVLSGLIGPHKAIHTVADRSLGKMVKGNTFWPSKGKIYIFIGSNYRP